MRPRRHTGKPDSAADPSTRAPKARRLWRDLALVAAIFVVGYLVSAIWVSPTPLIGSSSEHAVPHVIGLPESRALSELKTTGFRSQVSRTRTHPTKAAGTVLWQDPPSGVLLSKNSTVTLVLSSGPVAVSVPDVIGLDTATARDILTAAGIAVGDISSMAGGPEAGIVLATQPGVGVARPRGSAVGLVVSREPAASVIRKESP